MTIQEAMSLALQCHQAGNLADAEALYRQVLAAQPDQPDALHLLGTMAHQLGRHDVAIELIGKAVALYPGQAEYHLHFGLALAATNRRDQAIAAYRRAAELKPDSPDLHNRLGSALVAAGRWDEAEASYRRAMALRPDWPVIHNNLAAVYQARGEIRQAVASYDQALSLDPDRADYASHRLVALHYHPDYDAQALLAEHRAWNQRFAQPLQRFIQPHFNDRSPDRRLKIGYVSADFCDHVVGRNILPLLREHDRGQFEVFCYSNTTTSDGVTERFRSYADSWRSILGIHDEQAAELIRADRIDVLIDLSLHSVGNRLLLFARKPAPIQVAFAAYPGGTGLQAMDWRLTDPYLDPPGEFDGDYLERSHRLPGGFWCYDSESMTWEAHPHPGPIAQPGPMPAMENGHLTFGCLNNFCKVHDGVLEQWARVLQAVRRSRMVILAPPGQTRRRALDKFAGWNVRADRIDFVPNQPRRQHMAEFRRIDLCLDVWPYNGHTTHLDAAWMGVPGIGYVGRTVVGRATWSHLNYLKLTELAARTDEQFVSLAIELATDLPRLAELRRTLRKRMLDSPLTDAKRFAQNIEAAYRQMWKEWTISSQPDRSHQ